MKKIILLILPFILAGCTVNYELEVKEDLSVTEQITILENESYYDKLGNIDTAYKYVVDVGINETNYVNYKYLKQDNLYGTKITASYSTLEEYTKNAESFKQLYEDILITKDENIVIINSIGELNIEQVLYIPEEGQSTDYVIPENTFFSIKLPFNVLEHNADRVDTTYNTYYWDINKSTTKDKTIMIKFDTNKKHFSIDKLLKEMDYTISIIIVIIVVVIIFINNILRKNKLNNRI